jgi:hypothetical protein
MVFLSALSLALNVAMMIILLGLPATPLNFLSFMLNLTYATLQVVRFIINGKW